MSAGAARALLAALAAAALASAAPGASATARPPRAASLSASPGRLVLAGAAPRLLRVSNPGATAVVVDAAVSGFGLDLRGRPRVVAHGEESQMWLRVSPRRLRLAAGSTATIRVSARLPRHPRPGDHDALVLLTTRAPRQPRVAVRLQLGVVVDVRIRGAVTRRLDVRGLHVRDLAHGRLLELTVANRGDVTEAVAGAFSVSIYRGGHLVTRLRPRPRDLLPRSSGLAEVVYRGAAHGWFIAVVDVRRGGPRGRASQRAFRVRL